MRVIVVDDEAPARDELIYLLKQHPEVEVVAEADDAESALSACRRERPDVVFLDIHMPGEDGMVAARQISLLTEPPVLVFATAYDQHAVKAFEVNATDYILKPFSKERVAETVKKLQQLLKNKKSVNIMQRKIAVTEDDRIQLLDPEDIVYIARDGRDVIVKTENNSYTVNYTLQHLENRISRETFLKPHRSFLVNVNKIEKIEPWFKGYQLVMKDKAQSRVPISRGGMKEIRRLLDI
ncbi:DNA-binding LytR/AlgR family response regulator [Desulfohalotomaculum tongense]|uniref:LytR/AlgR family response regulator transcription factor n=1 Tax=Desulforadius tongensis TaxID=1216062 RepID=UPI001957A4C1|nr:LytTR family DNA-binding domain-containing protein [Desulforadius tongensis]MBM7856207.1 DNA-binding LytR/AlgR family response regulator [Desulforadius tongensis]